LNHGRFIDDNIQSVVNQNYPAVEHIIVDGGSTDGTIDILRMYDHVIWTSERDRGQSDALNKGFRAATGEIIGWINSDDKLAPGALMTVGEFFKHNPESMAVVGDMDVIDEMGRVLRRLRGRRLSHPYLLYKCKGVAQPSTFFRRSVFDEVGYIDEDLNYSMDYEFFLRLTKLGPIEYLPETLAQFRIHPQAKTARGTYRFELERLKIWRKHGGSLVSPAGRSALYVIVTEPFRRIAPLRTLVQRVRSRCRRVIRWSPPTR